MQTVFSILVAGPAWFIGSLVGETWAIVAFAAAIGVGYLVYGAFKPRLGHAVAVALSVVVGFYVAMVFWEAQKTIGVTMLQQYSDDDL